MLQRVFKFSMWIFIGISLAINEDQYFPEMDQMVAGYLDVNDYFKYDQTCERIHNNDNKIRCTCIVKNAQYSIYNTFTEWIKSSYNKYSGFSTYESEIFDWEYFGRIKEYIRLNELLGGYQFIPTISLYFDNIINIFDVSPIKRSDGIGNIRTEIYQLQWPQQLLKLKKYYVKNQCDKIPDYLSLNNAEIYHQYGQEYDTIYGNVLAKISQLFEPSDTLRLLIHLYQYCYSFHTLLLELHYETINPQLNPFKLQFNHNKIQFWQLVFEKTQLFERNIPMKAFVKLTQSLTEIRTKIRNQYLTYGNSNNADLSYDDLSEFALNLDDSLYFIKVGESKLEKYLTQNIMKLRSNMQKASMFLQNVENKFNYQMGQEYLADVSRICNILYGFRDHSEQIQHMCEICEAFWNILFSIPYFEKLYILD